MAKQLRGVIFDIDGTLIDSNDQHAQAWVDAFEQGGYGIPFETVRPLIGMGADNVLPQLTGHSKESQEGQRLAKWQGEAFKARHEATVRPFPRARDLVQQIKDKGLKLGVATSAKPEDVEKLLGIAGVADLFEVKTSSGDVKQSKPDPDIMHVALDQLGLDADEVIMIGDTPWDVAAAGKLDIPTIVFRCGGGHPDAALVGARALYDDPADLLAHFDDSPLART